MSVKTKTLFTALGAFVLALVAWKTGYLAETAYAIPIIPGAGAKTSGTLGGVLNDLIDKIAFVNTFMHVLLLITLQFLQYFLQADFFNDPTMMQSLFTIWKLCRDIMNVVFALALIGVSFYVIITAKSDLIKEKLAQFVIAVILVNMSWFFPRVIIDIANVLTSAVYSVPNLLPAGNTCNMIAPGGGTTPCKVITAVLVFPADKPEMDTWCNAHTGGASGTASCPCIPELECHALADYNTVASSLPSAHAMINGLAVSFAKISELATVPSGALPAGTPATTDAIRTSLRIGLSIMLAFLVQLAVFLPMVAMAVGFLIRIIILWVTTAFMPFSFFGYMINGKLGTNVFDFEVDIWKEFLNAAFLPAVVGVPIVIGFIMLTTVSTLPAPGGMPFDFTVPMINNVPSWWAMVWVFAAVGIIWKGSFSALGKSKIIGGVTDKIKGFGEYVGSGIAQLPLITPLPIPGLKGANLGTALNAPKFFADAIRTSAAGNSGKSFADTVKDRFGVRGPGGAGAGATPVDTDKLALDLKHIGDKHTTDIVDAINKLGTANEGQALIDIKNILASRGHGNVNDHDALQALKEAAAKQGAGEALRGPNIQKQIDDALVNHP